MDPYRPLLPWLAALLAGLCAAGHAAEPPTIRWRIDVTPPLIELAGAPAEALRPLAGAAPDSVRWAQLLAVFAEQGNAATTPPMAGTWLAADGRVHFTPRFPLAPGVRYRAEFRPADAPPVVSFFQLPPDSTAPTTVVTRIFPGAAVLPENQLKFYVHFSAPMSRGGTYEHVHLRDSAGQPIDLPFLELDEELWDPSMTRLTLLIDPGRIKRGVKPLEDIGPVFEEGKTYALTVGAACRDAAGRVLRTGFEKKFQVGAADRTAPDPRRWTIQAPAAGTRSALVVRFDEPMDQALALRLIRVVAGAGGGGVVEGACALTEEERQWTFVPESPWSRGRHELTVGTTIEDLAGNNIGKTFDVDLEEDGPRPFVAGTASVVFEVR